MNCKLQSERPAPPPKKKAGKRKKSKKEKKINLISCLSLAFKILRLAALNDVATLSHNLALGLNVNMVGHHRTTALMAAAAAGSW